MSGTTITENLQPAEKMCWPQGMPPVGSQEFKPSPVIGTTINRAYIWRPEPLKGYRPRLTRFSLNAINTSTELYDPAIAPEWWVGFIDPKRQDFPRRNGKFTPATLLRNPRDADIAFFESAGVFGVVRSSNEGAMWNWPAKDPETYWPLLFMAHRIGDLTRVTFVPVIDYVKDVERGG